MIIFIGDHSNNNNNCLFLLDFEIYLQYFFFLKVIIINFVVGHKAVHILILYVFTSKSKTTIYILGLLYTFAVKPTYIKK